MAFSLNEFSATLDSSGLYLSQEARCAAADAGYRYLQLFVELARVNLVANRCCYKVRPKLHLFQHILMSLDAGQTINPRLFSCWNDESVVGRIARCARGTHSKDSGRRILQRWLLELNRLLWRRKA